MFSSILGMLGQNKQEIAQGDVDEQSMSLPLPLL
jgi:hypothetical protein